MSEEDEYDLDDLSLSEGELAALEAELAAEEAENQQKQRGEATTTESHDDDTANDEDEEADDAPDEPRLIHAKDDVDLHKKEQQNATSSEAEPVETAPAASREEEILARLDKMAEGLNDAQVVARLRVRLEDEMMDYYQSDDTLRYISAKLERLQRLQKEKAPVASAEEIDECEGQIADLHDVLSDEQQQNDKMYEAILKLRAAHAKQSGELAQFKQEFHEGMQRRHQEIYHFRLSIQEQAKEFVHCKKDQNNQIRALDKELAALQEAVAEWKRKQAEIQADIDEVESEISSQLKKKEGIVSEKQDADDTHEIKLQKINLKLTRQQRSYEMAQSDFNRRQDDLTQQEDKLNKLKEEHQTMTDQLEQFNKQVRKQEKANGLQKIRIQDLEKDKDEARQSLRDAERKLRMKMI